MKVLFLDFDGVLNTFVHRGYYAPIDHQLSFCEKNMQSLNNIIEKTKTKIVLTTSHRYTPESVKKFTNECEQRGWGDIVIGITQDLYKSYMGYYTGDIRTNEIRDYINNHKEIDSWAIVDDVEINLENFVQTTCSVGLTDKHANTLINILNSKDKETSINNNNFSV
jgi:hypothetical protein